MRKGFAMKKIFLIFNIFLFFLSGLNADTYAYITKSALEGNSDLAEYKAELNVSLKMSDLISYDIGFSSNANALSPNRWSSTNITPSISSDYMTVSGHLENLYVYWNIVSNLNLKFSIALSGHMKNGESELPWKITTSDESGTEFIIESTDTQFKQIGSYSLERGKLGGYDLRNITIDITANIADWKIKEGTYVGSIYLNVEVN